MELMKNTFLQSFSLPKDDASIPSAHSTHSDDNNAFHCLAGEAQDPNEDAYVEDLWDSLTHVMATKYAKVSLPPTSRHSFSAPPSVAPPTSEVGSTSGNIPETIILPPVQQTENNVFDNLQGLYISDNQIPHGIYRRQSNGQNSPPASEVNLNLS
ncbi:hypothetical protein MRB53_010107 [Persea americana]|uniref:Uncharacterized protein n=1 Tax=Persea americana TaxID=3435 RepID=A0ACC2LR87_PERAE|nr:hypothetical protein MRB53_010107 [Persea americana]